MTEHDMWLKKFGVDRGPWAGGTWGGKCGAVHYFEGDPVVVQDYTSISVCRRTQIWAVADLIPGFYAECRLPYRHVLSHEGAGMRWPRTDLMKSAQHGSLKAARTEIDEYDIYSEWVTN